MTSDDRQSRRVFVRKLMLGAALAPLATVRSGRAADLPLLSPDDPAAHKVKYLEDAGTQKGLTKGNTCATCALYEGTYQSPQGPCQLFPGKHVKAAGWCSAWAPQL
jgi:hypothetical protein